MKLIFLDIDGVMNSYTSALSAKHESLAFDNRAVENLKLVINETGAKIVVSSTWRIGETIDSLKTRIFSHYGLDEHVIGITPYYIETIRGIEISDYMLSNENMRVDAFVILDDDTDMGNLKPFHVHVNRVYGLSVNDAKKAISILNRKEDSQ